MSTRAATAAIDARPWPGPWRRYDIIKEGVVALVIVSILTALFAAIFSSPDDAAITFKEWATSSPEAFQATAVQELAGTSGSATYGPPYNSNSEHVPCCTTSRCRSLPASTLAPSGRGNGPGSLSSP